MTGRLRRNMELTVEAPSASGRERPALAAHLRVPVTEALVERAEGMAWDYGLRGYDAVQLASAITWQEAVGTEILLATFDQQLWDVAPKAGLKAWPDARPA